MTAESATPTPADTSDARHSLRDLYEHGDITWETRPEAIAARAEPLRRRLAGIRRPIVVDLGCGPGDHTIGLQPHLPDARLIGIDWSQRAMLAAGDAGLSGVRADLDPASLPFADASIDAVLLCEVIEHLVDPDTVTAEAFRVLKPGGVFLVTTPNLAAWFNRLLLLGGIQPAFSEVSSRAVYGRPGTEVVGHLRLFTARALQEFLAGAGFVDVALTGLPYHDVPAPGRPLDRFLARRAPTLAADLVAAATKPVHLPTSPTPRRPHD